ncbi:MAG: TonB-dependent receptor [Verrucomicrobia bacterium]|nr:TonB-dependent receptor [Verrucomicrobiota bacterium]
MKPRTTLALFITCLLAALPMHAQSAAGGAPAKAVPPATAPGTVTGRVFSPNTGEYLRNAQVRIEETGQTTTSENGGEYRLSPVPAGRATLVVAYTGFRSASATVTIAAGATVTQDFNLISTLVTDTGPGTTIKLEKFVVSSEREGNAKAIMDQRNSMNVTNTVASDTFGDNAEGNIGEFMRHLPGVDLDQNYGEVRNVRLRGLGSEYTSVTIDGVSLASADANAGAAANARAFTMEMASLNSMESIEVSKTVSADVDANAPAGTINLKTKRAFDRAGRRFTWQATAAMHSEEFTLHRTPGPDDDRNSRKIRPGGILEYSDVFFDKRLGVVLNVSESNVYQEALITTHTFNRTPTAADLRPEVLTALSFQHAPRFNKRFATTLTTDFRATRQLALSLGLVYNYADLWTPQRTVTFNTGARATVIGPDPLLRFRTNSTAASAVVNPVGVAKLGETFTVLPKFEYKAGNLEVEGRIAYSDATSWYNPKNRRGTIRDANSPAATGVNWRAERSSTSDVDWKITQISGPDIATGASFTNPSLTVNDGRFSRSTLMSGEVIGTLKTSRLLPVTWKAGLKDRYELRKFEDDQLIKRYDYIGPGAGPAGAWSNYRSAYEYDLGMIDGGIASISGGKVFLPDLEKLGRLHRDRPGDFRQNVTVPNYYESFVARRRRFEEEIRAGFVMATGAVGSRATVRAGLRWEDTSTDATEPDTRPPAEVRAAGFPVAAGRATTIQGIDYQFLSQPRIHRKGDYDNLFPSGSIKYLFTRNLNLHLGYSSTIRRPTYANLAGVWAINDENLRVTAPNPGLRPETSQNLAARLAYYFEPVGQLSVSLFQNRVEDLHLSDQLTAEEFGYAGDDDLSNYTFVTTNNSESRVKIRGMEVEYSQSLSFLGERFRRLSVRASYTRNYAEIITPNLTPHGVSGGINYTLGRCNAYVNSNWSDDVPTSVTGLSYRRHRTNLDAGGGWRLTNHLSLSVSARNLLNTPYINMQRVPPNAATLTRNEITGLSYTFALKGVY